MPTFIVTCSDVENKGSFNTLILVLSSYEAYIQQDTTNKENKGIS
jgi:hypothetical protein